MVPGSDTGLSTSDDITDLNNSSLSKELLFQVGGTVAGATVTLLADGVPIGSTTASTTNAIVATDGATTLADGNHVFTAVQTEPGKPVSANSPPLTVKIDTTPPVATITSVTPNLRSSPVPQMTITFSEPVSRLDLSDLKLTLNGERKSRSLPRRRLRPVTED